MIWAVIHYDRYGLRVNSYSSSDAYEDGWFVDFVGTEEGARQFLEELDPVEFDYFLLAPSSVLKPPTIEEIYR